MKKVGSRFVLAEGKPSYRKPVITSFIMLGVVAASVSIGTLSFTNAAHSTTSRAKKLPDSCKMSLASADNVTAADEIASMEDVTLLQAGASLPLRLSPSGNITAGGSWSAEFGTIDTAGNYTAPDYMPPMGLDNVEYKDADGDVVKLQIRIQPNSSIPNSGTTPYVQTAWNFQNPPLAPTDTTQSAATPDEEAGSPSQETPASSNDTPYDSSKDLPALRASGPTVVVQPGQAPVAPVAVGYAYSTPVETVGGVNAYKLAATLDGQAASNFIYVPQQAGVVAPQQAKQVPDKIVQQCQSGQLEAQWTPYSTTVTPRLPSVKIMTITVNGDIKAEILKIFTVTLALNASYDVQGTYYDWKRVRKKHVYKCVNGEWVYQYTRTCVSYATALTTVPTWGIHYSGYPRNGQPKQWGPEACG